MSISAPASLCRPLPLLLLLGTLLTACTEETTSDDTLPTPDSGPVDATPDAPPAPFVVEALSKEETACQACDGGCTRAHLVYEGTQHLAQVTYTDSPAVGGPHLACWLPWQVYTHPVPENRWVHNLEHGGVVVLYNCPDGCETELEAMRAFATDGPDRLLAPEPTLSHRFAILAWEHRLLLDCWDEVAVADFYAAHADQAPESTTAPPPQSCQ